MFATSYNNLSSVYKDLGDLQQAKQYYEGALDIRIKQRGSNHLDVASSFMNLGSVHRHLDHLLAKE